MSSQRSQSFKSPSGSRSWHQNHGHHANRPYQRQETRGNRGNPTSPKSFYPSPQSSGLHSSQNNTASPSKGSWNNHTFRSPNASHGGTFRDDSRRHDNVPSPIGFNRFGDETRIRISDLGPQCVDPAASGMKSRPIKIEESPNKICRPSSNQQPPSTRGVVKSLDSMASPIEASFQACDIVNLPDSIGMQQQDAGGNMHLSIPEEFVVSSVEVGCIVGSVPAAASFLQCLQSVKSRWLKLTDKVLSPDIPFWTQIAVDFNISPAGHRISNWLTAYVIATILCSHTYSRCAKRQLSNDGGSTSDFITAVVKAHSMANQNKWKEWPLYENLKSDVEEFIMSKRQELILKKRPQSDEDFQDLMAALRQSVHKQPLTVAPGGARKEATGSGQNEGVRPQKKRPRSQSQRSQTLDDDMTHNSIPSRKKAKAANKTQHSTDDERDVSSLGKKPKKSKKLQKAGRKVKDSTPESEDEKAGEDKEQGLLERLDSLERQLKRMKKTKASRK